MSILVFDCRGWPASRTWTATLVIIHTGKTYGESIMSKIDWDTPEIAGRYDINSDHQYLKGVALVEMMKIKKGDAVLDMGCGTGRQAVNVSAIIGPGGSLAGVDPSSHRLQITREKLESHGVENARLIVGQCEDLSSLANASFDHAYFCSSFHWIDDKKKALGEIFRVLKPGGSIGMTTLDRSCPHTSRDITDKVLSKYECNTDTRNDAGGTKRVTAMELYDLLSEAGFADIYIEPKIFNTYYGSPDEFFERRRPGSPEGCLNGVPVELMQQVRDEILGELEKYTTPVGGIELESVTLFAIAKKPCSE